MVERLLTYYGRPRRPSATEPFAMAVWEAAAYLVSDDRRQQVFDRLMAKTRLDPLRLAALPDATLVALVADGGMQADHRARKVKAAADVAIEFGPDLAALARSDPAKARKVFRRFPGIGEPGADKMLLMNGAPAGLAPDSNALRVLLRLGFGRSGKGYSAEYRSVRDDVLGELPTDPAWRIAAHQLLRQHGQTLCKTNAPRCGDCPLATRCPARVLSVWGNAPGRGR